MGDPGGIGPQVTAQALSQLLTKDLKRIIILGDWKIFKRYKCSPLTQTTFFDLNYLKANSVIGKANRPNAIATLGYLNYAIDLAQAGKLSGIVTAPVCKETLSHIQPGFLGHTEYLATAFKAKRVGMFFSTTQLNTTIVTRHIPIAQVSQALTQKKILDTIELANTALKNQFKIKRPHIAVCGLNPHAGEGGAHRP